MSIGASDIIDLTISPPHLECTIIDSDEELDVHISTVPSQVTSTQPQDMKKHRKKKRKKSSVLAESQKSTAVNTRENSVEQVEVTEAIKRKRGESSSGKTNDGDEDKELSRKRSRISKESRAPSPPPSAPGNDVTDIFYVDVQPVPLPAAAKLLSSSEKENEGSKLLLPAHVSVLGSTPVDIIPISNTDEDDSDFIKYLDYDDAKDATRYFDEQPSESAKLTRTVCKNCGAEGEHKTSACPVLICLTCGARNEHHTRSCPISKVCFSCGMKGHINSNCPNRHKARAFASGRYDDCDRCGSGRHTTNECPTWWRLYEYFTDEEKALTISTRQAKKELKLGEGGEGYVADDEWCYNCGSCGHWGDDCLDVQRFDLPEEPSAFSLYNAMSGPFYDPDNESKPSTSRRREPRDWEQVDLGDWGKDAPENVGKQGRKKSMARLGKKAQEQQTDDDPDDWFGSSSRHRSGGGGGGGRGGGGGGGSKQVPTGPRKMTFGKSVGDGRQFEPPPSSAPSLLARLGDEYYQEDSRSRHHERSRDSYSSRSSRNRDDDRYDSRRKREYASGADRDRDKYRRREDNAPRYKGGYAR